MNKNSQLVTIFLYLLAISFLSSPTLGYRSDFSLHYFLLYSVSLTYSRVKPPLYFKIRSG